MNINIGTVWHLRMILPNVESMHARCLSVSQSSRTHPSLSRSHSFSRSRITHMLHHSLSHTLTHACTHTHTHTHSSRPRAHTHTLTHTHTHAHTHTRARTQKCECSNGANIGGRECVTQYSPCTAIRGHNLEYLDRQSISCPAGQLLARMKMTSYQCNSADLRCVCV